MALGKITKQELSEELYNSLAKQADIEVSATPADVEISGRTLVNLLGRYGNAIYKQFDSGHSHGTVGYENDAYTLTNTDTHAWITSLGTSHTFTKDKYYVVISEAYLVSGDNAYVNIVSKAPFENTSLFSTTEKNVWKTCCYRCKMGDPADGHPKPYFSMVVAGSDKTPSAKFKNARVYEITEAEYNALDGLTREQIGEKYPYVDDIKCVVNPYVECNENLLDGVFAVDGTFDMNGLPLADPNSISLFPNINANTGETYSLKVHGEYASDFIASMFICYGEYEAFHADNNGLKENTYTFSNSGISRIHIHNANFKNGLTVEVLKESINKGNTKIVLTKSSTPKSYDECHNSRVMFETKLYNGEKITRSNDGSYVKNSEWTELNILDVISNTIAVRSKHDGFTAIDISDVEFIRDYSHCVKYDGSILYKHTGVQVDGVEDWYSVEGYHKSIGWYINLPNNLTGWGNSYTPTQEEIRAFFLGWSMADETGAVYSGTGNKLWQKLYCGVGTAGLWSERGIYVVANEYTGTCPTEMNNRGYTPYRLIYKKETPTIEEVKTHGSLIVKDGVDIRVDSGLVLNEECQVFKSGTTYYSNVLGAKPYGKKVVNYLSNRTNDILKVEKDNEICNIISTQVTNSQANMIGTGIGTSKILSPINHLDTILIDYLIYKPDTVTSFPVVVDSPQSTKEILNKTIEELSNINGKLSAENRDLKNKIESLPQVSNPNLLINGDFQVWQRGTSFATIGTYQYYCADRWKYDLSSGNTGNIQKSECGLVFNNLKYWNGVTQIIDLDEVPYLKGKTITVSCELGAKVEFNTYLRIGSNTTTARNNHNYINLKEKSKGFVSYTIPKEHKYLLVWLNADFGDTAKTLTVKYIKAELGDKATPFTSRPYAEELAMCQRYYQTYQHLARIYNYSSTACYSRTLFPVEMRIAPTATLYDARIGWVSGGWMDGFTFTASTNTQSILLTGTKSAHGATDGYIRCSLVLDAEIY